MPLPQVESAWEVFGQRGCWSKADSEEMVLELSQGQIGEVRGGDQLASRGARERMGCKGLGNKV